MKTLLIFDWFGQDDIGFYLLDDPPEWLDECHRKYINSVESDDVAEQLMRISDAICENPEHYGNKDDELAGAWVSKKIDVDEVRVHDLGEVKVVVVGFVP